MQEASRYVGDILDQAGIYLQHPPSCDPTVPYINPHYLVRPGGTHPESTLGEQVGAPMRSSLNLSANPQLKGDVIKMLNSSAQGPSIYSKITPSSQMRTALKP